MRRAVLVAALVLASVERVQGQGHQYKYLNHPVPVAGAQFGSSTAVLDFDGDSVLDIAVAAIGQNKVYVFDGATDYNVYTVFSGSPGEAFGSDLAAGHWDAQPGEDLIVGASGATVAGSVHAGLVYVFGSTSSTPLVVLGATTPQPEANFGNSVAYGDLGTSGSPVLAVGAPHASQPTRPAGGSVELFQSGVGSIDQVWNPYPKDAGNFGHDLSLTDYDDDGALDLIISAVGNDSPSGGTFAGQVFVLLGPVPSTSLLAIDGPGPGPPTDDPRFGMSVAGGDSFVLIGAPRVDYSGIFNSGEGYVQIDGQSLDPYHPAPVFKGLFGYRAMGADLLGDSRPDYVFVALNATAAEGGVWAFDSNNPTNFVHYPQAPLAIDHWAQGVSHGQLIPGGKEELVLGGPKHQNLTGHVAILRVVGL